MHNLKILRFLANRLLPYSVPRLTRFMRFQFDVKCHGNIAFLLLLLLKNIEIKMKFKMIQPHF